MHSARGLKFRGSSKTFPQLSGCLTGCAVPPVSVSALTSQFLKGWLPKGLSKKQGRFFRLPKLAGLSRCGISHGDSWRIPQAEKKEAYAEALLQEKVQSRQEVSNWKQLVQRGSPVIAFPPTQNPRRRKQVCKHASFPSTAFGPWRAAPNAVQAGGACQTELRSREQSRGSNSSP